MVPIGRDTGFFVRLLENLMAMESVHIWLAHFQDFETFKAYFAEQYEDDDLPVNQFAADQAEDFYDHDWVEASFQKATTLRTLIENHSYADNYIEQVLEEATALEEKNFNALIVADSEQFTAPKTQQTVNYSLYYLGQFKGAKSDYL